MTEYTYKEIVDAANIIKNNVEKKYVLGANTRWSYFFAKQIIKPKTNVTRFSFTEAPSSTGDNISRQIMKKDYTDMANRLVKYVDNNKKLPNYITVNGLRMKVNDYCYMFARILAYYDKNKAWPNYANVNSKAFVKPTETTNDVYDYFVKVFGNFGDTIDGALQKISGRGYGYYYDDRYNNRQSIDRMKNKQGINCTDSCHVFYNIMLALIKKGKYRKVECLHVKCRGGDGHVRLRITMNDGTKIYRDPACTLSSGGTCNWCTSGYTLLAVDPSWFKANLYR